MDDALIRFGEIEDAFAAQFNRRYGPVEAIACEDAEIIFVTSGTVTSTCRLALQDLRAKGEKAGILKIKLLRPFPGERIREALRSAKKVAVIDRNFSFGAGGIFAQEIRAALCNAPDHPPVFGFIAGIGGRDVTPELLTEIYWQTKKSDAPQAESVWMGLKEVNHGA
jgi:pyruvate/2-oxoacid:ferredoxin oxidoreductase alpha subunit